uniref:HDC13251 n=1 Tax=Drosophila melanogaster TaxID=7227 RepID=Q6IK73_DROME|nr:TPA_inf: HDC13251 [Drosophila melanogaster]
MCHKQAGFLLPPKFSTHPEEKVLLTKSHHCPGHTIALHFVVARHLAHLHMTWLQVTLLLGSSPFNGEQAGRKGEDCDSGSWVISFLWHPAMATCKRALPLYEAKVPRPV